MMRRILCLNLMDGPEQKPRRRQSSSIFAEELQLPHFTRYFFLARKTQARTPGSQVYDLIIVNKRSAMCSRIVALDHAATHAHRIRNYDGISSLVLTLVVREVGLSGKVR